MDQSHQEISVLFMAGAASGDSAKFVVGGTGRDFSTYLVQTNGSLALAPSRSAVYNRGMLF